MKKKCKSFRFFIKIENLQSLGFEKIQKFMFSLQKSKKLRFFFTKIQKIHKPSSTPLSSKMPSNRAFDDEPSDCVFERFSSSCSVPCSSSSSASWAESKASPASPPSGGGLLFSSNIMDSASAVVLYRTPTKVVLFAGFEVTKFLIF